MFKLAPDKQDPITQECKQSISRREKTAKGRGWKRIWHLQGTDGEGDGNPLQYSCLENPMGGGAWWAAVHGVVKSRT